ncbi:MAG: hypothetical protein CMB65_05035 [Euryarchaeota archaeon]|nr:hypothetical protein [Euryarchaeota archaeon]
MLRLELDRLNHKDVRQRRLAVRRLFEHNDPAALSAFLEMLDSDDEWFVEKSVEAIRRWVSGEHRKVVVKLSIRKEKRLRLIAAEIAPRLGSDSLSILSTLCTDKDDGVRREAWRSRLAVDSGTIPVAIESDDHVVRKMAISSSGDTNFLEKMLQDQHPRVREAALDQMVLIGHIPESFDGVNDRRLRQKWAKLKIPMMIATEDISSIAELCMDPSASMRKIIAEYLDDIDWFEWTEIIDAAKQSNDRLLLPRLLRSKRGAVADELRLEVLQQSDDQARVRILEHLHGREISPSIAKILPSLSEDDNPLLAQVALSLINDAELLG